MENDDVFVPKVVSSASIEPSTSSSSHTIVADELGSTMSAVDDVFVRRIDSSSSNEGGSKSVAVEDGYSTPPNQRIPASPEASGFLRMMADDVSL